MTYDSLSMGRALAVLRQVWQRKFPLDEERMQTMLYGKACSGVSLDCVIQAAEEWSISQKYPPTPSELSTVARKIHQQRYPHIRLSAPTTNVVSEEVAQQRQSLEQNKAALDQRADFVWRKLNGDKGAVYEFWALAWERAGDDATRHAIRTGGATKEYLLDTLTAYRAGARPQNMFHRR